MLLVTRPREQALQWVRQLQSHGLAAGAVPLLEIESALDDPHRRQAWAHLAQAHLAVFVSPNAVAHFFGAQTGGWPEQTWAAAPGQGTAQALIQAGVPLHRILQPPANSAQFDSESLWPVLSAMAWQGRLAVILRGDGGREWLSDQLRNAGAQVEHWSVYRRRPPELQADERQRLQRAWQDPQGFLWLFSSSEALAHLPALLETSGLCAPGDQGGFLQWAASVPALATHPRIAAQAHRLGLTRTRSCRPAIADVVAASAEYNPSHREP